MSKQILTNKIILKDKFNHNLEVHISLENGELRTEKVVTTIEKEKVELNSITGL